MSDLIDPIADYFGISGASLLATLAVTSLVCNLIGRLIPDDATGWQSVVRNVAKVIGLSVSSRLTKGVSVSDVAKVLLESRIPPAPAGKGETVEDAARTVKSPWIAGVMALFLSLLLMGCTTTQMDRGIKVTNALCSNAPLAQLVLDQAVDSRSKSRVQSLLNFLHAKCPLVTLALDYRKADAAGVLPINPD